jgi:hypothetical protein
VIEQEISRLFRKNGWTWSVKDKGSIVPDEDDVLATLDEAAKLLHDEPVGAQVEVGRLIIQKKHLGHDVFMFVGEYE